MAQDSRRPPEHSSIKFRLIERWVARRLGDAAHERRVATIASTLFDLTAPLHALGPYARRALQLGALLHDVGRSVDKKDHPLGGARMILADTWLPLSNAERRAAAFLARYHKGAVPRKGAEKILTDSDDRDALRIVLALLRAADALDSRSIQSPRLVFALRASRLHVTCYLEEDSAKARRVYRRRKKFRLFEELLGRRVELDVRHAEVLQMVA
jgi:exopolyphosphatase/guanosine-5'-triphosphate,3'-diphosphate pyrophosphatase